MEIIRIQQISYITVRASLLNELSAIAPLANHVHAVASYAPALLNWTHPPPDMRSPSARNLDLSLP